MKIVIGEFELDVVSGQLEGAKKVQRNYLGKRILRTRINPSQPSSTGGR